MQDEIERGIRRVRLKTGSVILPDKTRVAFEELRKVCRREPDNAGLARAYELLFKELERDVRAMIHKKNHDSGFDQRIAVFLQGGYHLRARAAHYGQILAVPYALMTFLTTSGKAQVVNLCLLGLWQLGIIALNIKCRLERTYARKVFQSTINDHILAELEEWRPSSFDKKEEEEGANAKSNQTERSAP